MKKVFRLATLEDAEQLLDLTFRAYEPIRRLKINFAAAKADINLVKQNISNNACYVYEQEGVIIATVSIRMPWGLQPGPFGVPHIWWFAVDPSLGQKGVGSNLLRWVEEKILQDTLKAPAVSLGTADTHPWLIDMYERKGYVQAGDRNLGKGHKTVFLCKVLRPDLIEDQLINFPLHILSQFNQ